MDNLAQNYQTTSATVQGLDALFETTETPSQNEILSETNENVAETQNETSESLTVSEVVKRLGIPRSTVYRHIQSGKYQGVRGADGKVRIPLRQVETADLSHETLCETGNETVSHREIAGETENETVSHCEILTGTINETVAETLDIKGLLTKLEAATYRIGYLEAQLEAERQQVKLLTDSQHKPSWWQWVKSLFWG